VSLLSGDQGHRNRYKPSASSDRWADSDELEARSNEIFYDIALVAPVDGEQLKAAARVGARKGLKLVDALHFVAAMESQCALFLTNDARFRSSDGIEVVAATSL
jgi:predicted nucleic acid-binding protein